MSEQIVRSLDIAAIRRDGGTQARVGNHEETVESYAEAMRDGRWEWGPHNAVVVFRDPDNAHWLADGFHRVEAAQRAGRDSVVADIRQGQRRDAVLYAAGANADHGLRRTRADVRRAIETLLRDEEWRRWSNAEIARRAKATDKTVAAVRAELEASSEIPRIADRIVTRGGTTYTQSPAAPAPIDPAAEIRLGLALLAGRAAAGPLSADDIETLERLDDELEGLAELLTDAQYESLARQIGDLSTDAASPAPPAEPVGDAPLSESELIGLSYLGGWEVERERISPAGLSLIKMRSTHDDPDGITEERSPGGWRLLLAELRENEARREANKALERRGIAPHTPAERVPADWDAWQARARALGGALSLTQAGVISMVIGGLAGGVDAGVRDARSKWPAVCARIEALEAARRPAEAPAANPAPVADFVAAQRRAQAIGGNLGWHGGQFVIVEPDGGRSAFPPAAWDAALARVAHLERMADGEAPAAEPAPAPASEIAPNAGALYAQAERGPLAEILRLSPQALRLLGVIHFGCTVEDDDEDVTDWMWESLTNDAQALDDATLAWALRAEPVALREAA